MNSFFTQKMAKEQLDKGIYYSEAKKWYVDRYLSPYIERSYFIAFAAIAIITSIFSIVTLLSIMPLSKEITYVTVHPNMAREFMEMKKLASSDEEDPTIYEKKLVSTIAVEFIEAFEKYEYNNYTKAKNMLNQFATDNIKKAYQREVSINNPRGRLLRYRQSTKRLITVLNDTVRVWDYRSRPDLAKDQYVVQADFLAEEQGQGVNKTEKWSAIMQIEYSGMEFDKSANDYKPFDLVIYKYQSTIKDVAS